MTARRALHNTVLLQPRGTAVFCASVLAPGFLFVLHYSGAWTVASRYLQGNCRRRRYFRDGLPTAFRSGSYFFLAGKQAILWFLFTAAYEPSIYPVGGYN